METLSEVRHRKVLGPWQAATVVVGMVVGAGIFRSASGVAQMLDSGKIALVLREADGKAAGGSGGAHRTGHGVSFRPA